MRRTYARPLLIAKSDLSDEPESITKKKGSRCRLPFCALSDLKLELVSVVYIPIEPLAASPGAANLSNPEVFLYGRGQV